MTSSLSLTLHGLGLITVYSLYGILQERIMKGTYGLDAERFTSSALLILCNRIFSIAVGLAVLFFKSKSRHVSNGEPSPGFIRRLRPASPMFAYAAVASFNFLSTTSQYEALKYVSYTTQSLAKCAKMVPVLIVGAVVYKKKHTQKEWVAGGIIVAGCGAYLFSQPPKHPSKLSDPSSLDGLLGTLFLVGYLFFDGLVSTTQERVFGKNPSSSDPFGPESPVLDQMIWTNIFAAIIAIISTLVSNAAGKLLPSLTLLLTTPQLMWDVGVFSAASALGLIILLNTIASFGALNSSLIMTTRQFLSIILNAGIFGNFRAVGAQGWCGVGWVASGIYIKLNRRFDPPKTSVVDARLLDVKTEVDTQGPPQMAIIPERFPFRRYFHQYMLPIVIPFAIAIAIAIAIAPTMSNSRPLLSSFGTGAIDDAQTINQLDAAEVEQISGGTVLEGQWDAEVNDAVSFGCTPNYVTKAYDGGVRTGFVSFPRSGNSYLRSLIETATGYQTSSIYCDKGLARTFLGECDHKTEFFVKTHFPALPKKPILNSEDYFKRFDQAVHLVRNPLDSVASWWHLEHVPKTPDGFQNHEGRVAIEKFGIAQRASIIDLAKRWRDHATYWSQAPLLTHTLRYEDLKATPIPQMMSLLAFLLPTRDHPSLAEVECLLEKEGGHDAYKSRKSSDFASWDSWEDGLRLEVLSITRRPFCAFGYDRLLSERIGEVRDLIDFCKDVRFDEERS